MQIKYYRLGTGEILPCIEDNGKYYKLFINPNYVINKSTWENFTQTEEIACPLNIPRPQQKQWYEDVYVDKHNLVSNIRRVVESFKDVEAMNELLAQGVVTPECEDCALDADWKTFRTTKKRPQRIPYYRIQRVGFGRVELPLRRAFDSYDEIMEYTVQVQFDDNDCADIFEQAPPEMVYYIRALVDAMPRSSDIKWENHEMLLRTFKGNYEQIYEVPEDWTPDWWRYPSRKSAIDFFLHLNRRRPPKTRERMLAFEPRYSNRHVLNYVLRPILGKPVANYIVDKQFEEVKQVKIEHPEWKFDEIIEYLGMAGKYANPIVNFYLHTGQGFNDWWKEYCAEHEPQPTEQPKKKRGRKKKSES